MTDDEMRWEEDGGAVMTNAPVRSIFPTMEEWDNAIQSLEPKKCRVCGDDWGPKLQQLEGWICLRHLPKVGERRGFLR